MRIREQDPVAWAKGVLAHVAKQKIRWGSLYDIGKDTTYSPQDIADAAAILHVELEDKPSGVPKDEHTKVQRQLTAAKAREGKLKKKVAQLETDVQSVLEQLTRAESKLASLES